jgi:hypothetical protein
MRPVVGFVLSNVLISVWFPIRLVDGFGLIKKATAFLICFLVGVSIGHGDFVFQALALKR